MPDISRSFSLSTSLVRRISIFGLLMATVILPSHLGAGPLTATGTGVDDINTTTLIATQYFQTCIYITQGLDTAGFNAANGWQFTYAATPVANGDFTFNTYSAWAVTNTPVADPGGTMRARPVTNADAGGANLALTYTPTAVTDPTGIHFIQAYFENLQEVTGGTEANPTITNVNQILLDNLGQATPWYDPGGISSIAAGMNPSWLFDIPYDCENSGTPSANGTNIGMSPTCSGGNDGFLLASSVIFQTFVAKDMGPIAGTGIAHNVILYGGEQWGYNYSNVDTPEPGLGIATALGLFGLVILRRRATDR